MKNQTNNNQHRVEASQIALHVQPGAGCLNEGGEGMKGIDVERAHLTNALKNTLESAEYQIQEASTTKQKGHICSDLEQQLAGFKVAVLALGLSYKAMYADAYKRMYPIPKHL